MEIKNKVAEIFNAATKNPMGGVNLCKRIAATVVAVVMGVCGSGVAAWAAAEAPSCCTVCGARINTQRVSAIEVVHKTYEEYYGVATNSNVHNLSSFVYQDTDLLVAENDEGCLCKSCLEEILSGNVSSGSTQVTAEVASTYSIIVPQAITLDGSGQSGTYSKTFSVTVKGDIGENQQITVTATPPTMKCPGCTDVAAAFTAGYKTTWNRSEAAANSCAGTAADYTVSATLTPGEWTGTATFACSLGG